jgi:hypothetical protein
MMHHSLPKHADVGSNNQIPGTLHGHAPGSLRIIFILENIHVDRLSIHVHG